MFRNAPGVLLALACASLPSWPANAEPAPAAEVEPRLQALKAGTIQLGAELEAAERALLYPEGTLATVHVAIRGSGGAFLLESVSVSVDGGKPQRHHYTGAEAIALLTDGGWHRLARLRLAPGAHRLLAEFSGRFNDARAGEPPVTGRVEAPFDKGAADVDLVLPILRDRMSRAVTLAPPEVLSAGAADASFHRALFLRAGHRQLSALVALKDAPASGPGLLLAAECYAGLGMDAEADALYRRIAAVPHDAVTLGRAQLQLAQFDYQHGRFDRAADRLRALEKGLPASLRDDWRALLAGALLGQGRNAEVAALLGDDEESVPPLLRFNLAVALIRAGKVARGREQLEAIGTLETTDLEQLVLRDKANLTLGYQHLQEQRGAAARAVFARIGAQGPYSNRGLLGIGWAEVAQNAPARARAAAAGSLGALLQSAPALPAGERLDVEGAAPATLPAAEQDALRRALRAWLELVKRDPMDPAVQEGFLAIPWALDRLHANEQSVARYLEAIAALEAARGRMDEAMRSIRRSVMVGNILRRDADSERGWLWKVRDLPNVPETYFLQSLLAEHRFQEALKLYRDAGMLARRLEEWKPRAAGAPATLRARVDALAVQAAALGTAQHKQVEALSARELEGQRATIERYLTEARFAVARIYDRGHEAGAP